MKKKIITTAALLLLFLAAGGVLLYRYIYIDAITGIRVLNLPEGGYTLTRYTREARVPVAAKAEVRNGRADGTLLYESSDPVVAEVTAEGVLIGHTPGTVTLRIAAAGNPKVYIEVPVTVVQKAVGM